MSYPPEFIAKQEARREELEELREDIKLLKAEYKSDKTTGAEIPSTWDSYCGQPSAIIGEINNFTDLERTQCESSQKADLRNLYESGLINDRETALLAGRAIFETLKRLREELAETYGLEDKLIKFYREQAIEFVDQYAVRLAKVKKGLRSKDISRIRKARELAKSYNGDDLNYYKSQNKIGYSPKLDEIIRLITEAR
jgi:hypothetical protein